MASDWGNLNYNTFSDSMGSWYDRQVKPRNNGPGDDEEGQQQAQANIDDPIDLSAVMGMYDQYTSSNPPNEQEQQRLGNLTNRAQRLQPMSQDRVYGARRIGGNPYSIDSTGLITGAANLAKGGINRVRRKRLEGISDEYGNLAGREAQAQEVEQGRRELLGDMLPKQFTQSQQNYRTRYTENEQTKRNTADNQTRIKVEDLKHANDKEIAQFEHGLKKDFADYANELEKSEGGAMSPSIVTGMAKTATDLAKARERRAERLRKIKEENSFYEEDYPNIDERIEQYESDADQLYKVATNVFTSEGGIDQASVQQMKSLIDGGGNNSNSDSDLVSPNNQGQEMTQERIEEIVRGIIGGGTGATTASTSKNSDQTSAPLDNL